MPNFRPNGISISITDKFTNSGIANNYLWELGTLNNSWPWGSNGHLSMKNRFSLCLCRSSSTAEFCCMNRIVEDRSESMASCILCIPFRFNRANIKKSKCYTENICLWSWRNVLVGTRCICTIKKPLCSLDINSWGTGRAYMNHRRECC